MTTRVVLVDDHELMLDGLRTLFAQDAEFEVVGQAEDARSAVELAGALRPDVVVMDVSLPDVSGIEATRQVLGQAPEGKVVALSMHADPQYVAGMLQALPVRRGGERRPPGAVPHRRGGGNPQPVRSYETGEVPWWVQVVDPEGSL